jgi:hypothetical protein
MTDAFLGIGAELAWSDGASTPVFTSIGEVRTCTFSGNTRSFEDATNYGSPDGFMEYIPGLRDGGEPQFTLNATAGAYGRLLAFFAEDTPRTWRITLNNTEASVITFSAYVASVPLEIPAPNIVTIQATLKITGSPTFTS